ncbi:MAG: HEAT repeat domain-containing protein [Pyrinomonadaceae bacterium]
MRAMIRLLNHLRHARKTLVAGVALIVCLAGVVSVQLAYGLDQDVQKLNRFVQTSRTNTPAMTMFREGRDLIERENWQKAAEKFQGFVAEFPKDRDVDAALYWYAYALQKQDKKDAAAAPLLRLIKDFPNSSWRREAESMLVVLGRGDAVQQALDRNNCEIKILALQSLFQVNEDRAISFVTEVVKSNSESCPGLKAAAVSLAGSHGGSRVVPLLLEIARNQGDMKLRLTAIKRLGEQNSDAVADELSRLYDADKTKEIRAQILRAFAEMRSPRGETKLIEVARGGDDLAVRQLAIRYLGNVQGGASMDELLRIFDTDRTPEIRSQILRALSEREDPRARAKLLEVARKGETPELRIEAIRRLGDRGKIAIEDLLQLYSTETNAAIKQGLIRTYADINDPRARVKLFEIARSGDIPVLRMYAIRSLGGKNDAETTDQLIAMYDAETDVQIKAMLIRGFGDSQQKNAVRKLMAIAREGTSVDLRKMAVRLLGESKDPEALKFLEDLLK